MFHRVLKFTLAHSSLTTHMESDTRTTISVGLRWCFSHSSLVNVIFGGATIFLLRGVGASNDVGTRPDIQNFRECVSSIPLYGNMHIETTRLNS
jgi:hypothetical protein